MSDTRACTGRSSRLLAGVAVLAGAMPVAWPTAVGAEVLFENPGNTLGWGRVFTQKAGTITEVSSPVYKGATAVKTTQTYQSSDAKNYHSEIIKAQAHLAGQDLYYGHAVYLPPDWVFHNQNVTFQQWAPEQPEAPWILMYLQGEKIRLGGRGANGDKDAGNVTGLRGTWISFITRIHMAEDGAFEVWINGNRTFSQRGNFRAHGPSMRWSNGIYCTRWDTETPTGPRELSFWHDNMRIATTYAEADPATWGDNEPARPDAGSDGATAGGDAANPATADGATGAGGSGGPSGGTGGSSGGSDPGTGGSTPAPSGSGRGTGGRASGSASGGSAGASSSAPAAPADGCRFGGAGGGPASTTPWLVLLAALWLLRRAGKHRG